MKLFGCFLRENSVFLWGKIVMLTDFSEANVLKHYVFSLFFRDFFSGKNAWRRNSILIYKHRFCTIEKWRKKACLLVFSMNLKIAKILNEVCIFDDFLWWSMLNFEKVKKWILTVIWPRESYKLGGLEGGKNRNIRVSLGVQAEQRQAISPVLYFITL